MATPMQDPSRILASFHKVKLSGRIELTTALQIAQVRNGLGYILLQDAKRRNRIVENDAIWGNRRWSLFIKCIYISSVRKGVYVCKHLSIF